MLRSYKEHVLNEKKDTKAEKAEIQEKIMKLFKEKPIVKPKSDKWPDTKGIYSLAHIKNYIEGNSEKVDQIFQDMRDDKKIKHILVKIKAYKENYPFFYYEDYVSNDEADKLKNDLEKIQKDVPKFIPKPKEDKKILKKKSEPKKPKEKKVPTEGQAKAKAKAYIRRKKSN